MVKSEDFEHACLAFAHGEAADSVAREDDFFQRGGGAFAQSRIDAALYDAE